MQWQEPREVVQVPSQNGHPCDTAGAVKEGEGDDILADDQAESSRCKQRQARCYALDIVYFWVESAGSDGSTEEVPLWQSKCVKGPQQEGCKSWAAHGDFDIMDGMPWHLSERGATKEWSEVDGETASQASRRREQARYRYIASK
ncbi:hypothetical protein TEQG_00943 [Trichophyton equinum CBS 127.97]|uniref:Uncharacterized protein n=1 Tax=Trichophyton equinum (strain ATCC MYA-4606 / CBS 127.97) TaxID=559882 RepID=F2PJ33_TRIEC|nr:hypothetical protein TEQG_00943 [Trichophyton equinum CBS 127.97]